MHEIEQLERAWRRYRIKKLWPYFTVATLGVVVAGVIVFKPTLSLPDHEKTAGEAQIQAKTEPVKPPSSGQTAEPSVTAVSQVPTKSPAVTSSAPSKVVPTPRSDIPVKSQEQQSDKNEPSVVLNPDTSFLASFEKETFENPKPTRKRVEPEKVVTTKPVQEPTRTRKTIDKPKNTVKPQPAIPEKLATETEPQSEPSGKLVISTKQTNNTLQYLIDKFNQTRDPKLATYIANSYYKKGAYKETIRWAIMANSLDPASEESWLLFAKAKTKLGQREDAISALKIYLNQYPSKRVKAYLQSLETGL